MKVFLAYKPNQHRSQRVMTAFTRSILQAGHKPWGKTEDADAGIIYGMGPGHVLYRDELVARGKPVLIVDLGFWNRSYSLGDKAQYKVSVNSHHPCDLIQNLKCSSDRFQKLGLTIEPWKTPGRHILLAGMGQKSCVLYKYPDQSWDLSAVKDLRQHTKRDIWYKPKPSWRGCPPIAGTVYTVDTPIETALEGAFACVTHHSNAAVDALLKGVPAFTWDGAAKHMAINDLSKIETPFYPDNREQFFSSLAYFNWSVAEIASGECWRWMYKNYLR